MSRPRDAIFGMKPGSVKPLALRAQAADLRAR
jgi:hypothetical protein